jgi:Uncharacterized protein conserved in bacteria
MPYDHSKFDNRRKAFFMLKKLLPEAERLAATFDLSGKSMTPIMDALSPHLHITRVAGVHIYKGDKGGWFFDIVFKDLPPGLPTIIGQPSSMPCETREEAEKAATNMLAALVQQRDKPLPDQVEAEAVFQFDEVYIYIPTEIVASLERSGAPDLGYVRQRLAEIRKAFAGDGVMTKEVVDRLNDDQMTRLYAVVAMAVAAGIIRWPEPDEAPPRSRKH